MKIIFTDVDGVLNENTIPTRTKNRYIFIDQDKLLRLKHIVDTTGAKIVLSSTWRYDRDNPKLNDDFLELLEAFHSVGLDFYDFTPVDAIGIRRGMEIRAWLGLHRGEVDQFIILDDELFDFEERGLLPRLIKTDFAHGGLTEELVQEAIDLLMDKPQHECDAKTKSWLEKQPSWYCCTLAQCEACGLMYNPAFGHTCPIPEEK